jgi:hypothetical protein
MVADLYAFLAGIDDYGVPIVAAALLIICACKARHMSRSTALPDALSIVVLGAGAAGVCAEFVKWVDAGSWPQLLLVAGAAGWLGFKNLRDAYGARIPVDGSVWRAVRAAIGMREVL